jgi:hypothetical protein
MTEFSGYFDIGCPCCGLLLENVATLGPSWRAQLWHPLQKMKLCFQLEVWRSRRVPFWGFHEAHNLDNLHKKYNRIFNWKFEGVGVKIFFVRVAPFIKVPMHQCSPNGDCCRGTPMSNHPRTPSNPEKHVSCQIHIVVYNGRRYVKTISFACWCVENLNTLFRTLLHLWQCLNERWKGCQTGSQDSVMFCLKWSWILFWSILERFRTKLIVQGSCWDTSLIRSCLDKRPSDSGFNRRNPP